MKQRRPWILLLLAAAAIALPAGAAADQSSQPSSPVAGHIAAGESHSCALSSAATRCWGFGGNGRLGYGNTNSIGDNEVPAAAGPISLGAGRSATAVTAGRGHTCALLDDATVRCWGFGGNGRLGYDNTTDVDDPGSVDPVDFGGGRTATAISAGDAHTCAVLDDGTVRCWGYAAAGQLGYANTTDVDDPGSVGPVDLGGVEATAITAGESHTCALLENGTVRCWGYGLYGQLGNGDNDPDNLNIGDDELPTFKPPVFLGAGRTATAISAGNLHSCALLDNRTVRCWGYGGNGQLGYANTSRIGDNETPGSLADPVNLGLGRTATAISAGRQHSCAILDSGSVRCWGGGSFGQLGYANQRSIGDDEAPGSAGPVALGAGRTAIAIDTGVFHTCALLDSTNVRCWGYGANGRLGYCNEVNVGDTETPAAIGPVNLGAGGAGCAAPAAPRPAAPAPPGAAPPPASDDGAAALRAQAARSRRLRACLRAANRRPKARRARARRACLKRHGRTPGKVRRLRARALSRTRVVLTFDASGSDRQHEPPARTYLVKQSLRPMRRGRDFARASALCRGACRFGPPSVGTRLTLTVTGLEPATTYYFAVAARDNVSRRRGPRSLTVRVRTR